MRARHREHVTALEHMLGQPLGAAGVGHACFQNGLHQRKLRISVGQAGTADHVANHEHIRVERHLVGAKPFDQVDAQRAQLIAHGRIDTCVAARHGMARLACQRGKPPHERAADSQNVYVHGRRF